MNLWAYAFLAVLETDAVWKLAEERAGTASFEMIRAYAEDIARAYANQFVSGTQS